MAIKMITTLRKNSGNRYELSIQINVIGQIFLTNRFLGGEFLRYGIEVVQFLDQDPETRVDPMARVFPRLTKCVFHKYGSSGKR